MKHFELFRKECCEIKKCNVRYCAEKNKDTYNICYIEWADQTITDLLEGKRQLKEI